MKTRIIHKLFVVALCTVLLGGCVPALKVTKTENKSVPQSFNNSTDTTNSAKIKWREYFTDTNLIALVDTALKNNQELNILLQEIDIGRNEVKDKKGEYLPFVGVTVDGGLEKTPEYTRNGSVEHNLEVKPGKEFPEPLGDLRLGIFSSWEIDVWKKLRNAKKAAVERYLASVEGRNFMVTNLIAEIANSYYELMALDNQLNIVRKNIEIQSDALHIIKQEKEAAEVTQLAVNRFHAQLLNTQNLQYEIQQQIVETENRINFLVGRFPQPVKRSWETFSNLQLDSLYAGIPAQLLANRPDIRQAEFELRAAKLDVKVARANFFPALKISAGIGLQAFNPVFMFNPESILVNLFGELTAPLVNRNAIKAAYFSATARQIQSVYEYERAILNAYIEVINQLSKADNYSKSYQTKFNEVDILNKSVTISNSLFKSARADYMEVLLTQREVLESKMELTEIKMKELAAKVNIYKALGGGWN